MIWAIFFYIVLFTVGIAAIGMYQPGPPVEQKPEPKVEDNPSPEERQRWEQPK